MEKKLKIGLLTSMPDENYTGILINGIAAACRNYGISLNIYSGNPVNSSNLNEREQNAIYQFANESALDGLIFSTASLYWRSSVNIGSGFFERFQNIPSVSIGIALPGSATLKEDNLLGMKMIVSHLIKDHHFRNIAFVGGHIKAPVSDIRYQAYREVLAENDIPYDPLLYYQGDFTKESGIAAVRELIGVRNRQMEAIVCSNDEMAYGVIKELQVMGYHIPRDMAVTGFDNLENFRFICPSFTTAFHPIYEQGYKSVELLLNKIKGIDIPQITLLPPHLMIRESCGCKENLLPAHVTDTDYQSLMDQDYKSFVKLLFDSVIYNFNPGIHQGNQLFIITHQLLSRLSSDLFENNSSYSKFTEYLSENIARENAGLFREILNITYKVCHQMFKNKPQLSLIDNCFSNAFCIMTEHYRSYQSEIYWKMRLLNDVISSKETLEDLLANISKEFFNIIGLRCFYISFYYDKRNHHFNFEHVPSEFSKLMLAYDDGIIELREEERIFPTKELLPKQLHHSDDLILFNLNLSYMDQHYGFITFEYDEHSQKYYEFIQEQLSIAIDTLYLIEGIKREKDFAVSLQQKAERQLEDFLTALGSAIESKDDYTGGHVERVGLYARDIAIKLGLSAQEVRDIYLGAIVHDVGKIGIKDHILNKPGKLTPEEMKHIQQHPEIGREILSKIHDIDTAIQIAYCHQERYDGSGYPNGLKGEDIPLCARIAAIADYWDAITTERPYRSAMSLKSAIDLMKSESGKAFEPRLLKLFMDEKEKIFLNYVPREKLKELA